MLDPKVIRSNPEIVRESLAKRGAPLSLLETFLESDSAWRAKTAEYEKLKSEQNEATQRISALKREKKDASELLLEMKELSEKAKDKGEELRRAEENVSARALVIPNIIEPDVPAGKDASFNVEIRKWGTISSRAPAIKK